MTGVARLARTAFLLSFVAISSLLAAGCSSKDSCSADCESSSDCLAQCICQAKKSQSECEASCGENLASTEPLSQAAQEWRDAYILLVDKTRQEGGCCEETCLDASSSSLGEEEALTIAAQRHADDMKERGYISHTTPEGLGASDRALRAGLQTCLVGENITAGTSLSPADALDEFLQSPKHCENLLSPEFNVYGVGLTQEGEALYVVHMFGD